MSHSVLFVKIVRAPPMANFTLPIWTLSPQMGLPMSGVGSPFNEDAQVLGEVPK